MSITLQYSDYDMEFVCSKECWLEYFGDFYYEDQENERYQEEQDYYNELEYNKYMANVNIKL